MSINKFKKMVMVGSLAVIAISANAQDLDEKDSVVATGMSAHSIQVRVDENALGDSDGSGLANVLYDQLVIQPCQGLLSAAAGFCKFAQQNPTTALAMTAAYALPVVAALLPEQSSNLWYPQFTCARSPDIQQVTTFVGSSTQTLAFAPADGRYQFAPYKGSPSFASAAQCAYQTSQYWYGPPGCSGISSYTYINANCSGACDSAPRASTYQWGQANYTGFYSDQQGPSFTVTSWCAKVPAPTPAP